MGFGRISAFTSESVTGRYCQESTRNLAQGIVTGAATGTATLPDISGQDHRMRQRIAKAPAVGGVESRPPDTTLRREAQGQKGSPRECSEIRPTVGVVSDYWSRLVPGQRH